MIIDKLKESDSEYLFQMMREFYDSPALLHHSSDEILKTDIRDCLDTDNPFVECFIFREEGGEKIIGYSMIAKNYSTEYGGLCIWIEDLFFEEAYRHKGYGSQFFEFIEKQYPVAVRFKLEVEPENEHAVAAYKKNGYNVSGYFQMTKEIE